jgi:hypothetical protein
VLLFAVWGCGVSKGTVQRSGGWLHYSNPDEGFSLSVPDSWVIMAPDDEELTSAIDSVKKANPAMAKFMDKGPLRGQLGTLASSGVKMLAYDTRSDVEAMNFATNLNVVRMSVPPGANSLKQVADVNVKELKRAFGSMMTTDVYQASVKVGKEKLPAERLDYNYSAALAGGDVLDASAEQYLLLKDGEEYVFTFTTTSDEVNSLLPTFDRIVASVALTK